MNEWRALQARRWRTSTEWKLIGIGLKRNQFVTFSSYALYSHSRREEIKGLVGQKYPKNKLVLSKSRAPSRKITEICIKEPLNGHWGPTAELEVRGTLPRFRWRERVQGELVARVLFQNWGTLPWSSLGPARSLAEFRKEGSHLPGVGLVCVTPLGCARRPSWILALVSPTVWSCFVFF